METETQEPIFTGLLEDDRSEEAKAKDYKAEEVLDTSSAVEWKHKDDDELKKYPIWSQNGAGACVAFTFAKVLGVEIFRNSKVWVDLSPAFFYQQRRNQNSAGMNTYDACEIADNIGTTLEALMPSQELTEAEINAVPQTQFAKNVAAAVATAVESYFYLPKNMDAVARVLDMDKAVATSIFATSGEYRGKEVPVVKDRNLKRSEASILHKVTITDRYLHPKYGKVFVVDDSWGMDAGKGGRRLFTEDWFMTRCTDLVYFDKFEFDNADSDRPTYTFTKPLEYSTTVEYDADVVALQNILKYEGVFPSNVESSGYYGAITAKAVYAFQVKYAVASLAELNELGGKRVGGKTIAKLNELYAQ